ncbi:MAG: hypothetical protein ACYCVH_14525 [Ignavibacteriaceae bacterium]
MNFSLKNIFEKKYFPIIFIFFITLLLYFPSIKIPFVNDEIAFIQRNRAFTLSDLLSLFNKKDYDGYYYRPLANFVSGITTLIFNYNFVYYRIFNLLLHAVAGIILYYFLSFLLKDNSKKKIISFFAALLFIAFPLNDYVVFWQTDLFDRLMLIFYLAGLAGFVKNNFKPGFFSLFFFLLAMMSKEMAFSFPLVIILITFFFGQNEKRIYKSVLNSVPYLAVMAIFILFRIVLFNNNVFAAKDAHSAGTLFDVLKNYTLFSGLLVFPFFIREIQFFFLSHKFITAILIIPLVIPLMYFLFAKIKKEPLLIFFILFVVITIAPASRLFLRWYLYLPEVGFTAFLSYLIFSTKFRTKNLSLVIATALFIIYSGASIIKEKSWVENSNEAVSLLGNFINENKSAIVKSGRVDFLTIPAKVDDIPVFQLGFDKLFNFYANLPKPVEVNVYSKSLVSNLSDTILIDHKTDKIILTQTDDNYFILFNNGKNINFESNDYKNENRSTLTIKILEMKNKALYTFSNGKFFKVKGLE